MRIERRLRRGYPTFAYDQAGREFDPTSWLDAAFDGRPSRHLLLMNEIGYRRPRGVLAATRSRPVTSPDRILYLDARIHLGNTTARIIVENNSTFPTTDVGHGALYTGPPQAADAASSSP